MEFNEKLQELRKKKGLTQEELAARLYVSRTAVSKWESGRGYPSLDSLREIAKFFHVTVDELLSGEELLTAAENDGRQRASGFRDLSFGLLDASFALLLFLPLFVERAGESVRALSLLSFASAPLYLRVAYFAVVTLATLLGILTLALQNLQSRGWVRCKGKISLLLHTASVLLMIVSGQIYAAVFLFVLLAIKVLLLLKRP